MLFPISSLALPGGNVPGTSSKQYTFDTFLGGIDFINRVAEMAEEVDHHPDITVYYRRVTFTLWTHSVGGLTERDFNLARQMERASQSRSD